MSEGIAEFEFAGEENDGGQETNTTKFDETLVKKLVEKTIVFIDRFTVEFKSGITIDIEA